MKISDKNNKNHIIDENKDIINENIDYITNKIIIKGIYNIINENINYIIDKMWII